MIELADVSVTFGTVKALDRVSAVIHEPVTGLIGPNGAGKTTLLNAVAGSVRSTGSIRLNGTDISAMAPFERVRLGIGRTFQAEELSRAMNVFEHVLVGGDARPRGERGQGDREAAELLELVGLGGAPQRSVQTLTNLERRKVALARALMTRPQALLMDEPAAGLLTDEKTELERVIDTVHERLDVQVVLVEHDIDMVARSCSDCLVLDFGCLIARGTPAEVLSSAEVRAAYLGETHQDDAA